MQLSWEDGKQTGRTRADNTKMDLKKQVKVTEWSGLMEDPVAGSSQQGEEPLGFVEDCSP